jgi:uncharacterized membrane protein YdbT with pleckstrin-like domain
MSNENILISKVSQMTNTMSFVVTIIITALCIYMSEHLASITGGIFDLIGSISEAPDITTSITLYAVLFVVWARMAWKILVVKNLYYRFEEERIALHSGVLNKEVDYMEYFRIKDYTIKRPLIARIFKLHDLEIISTDRTHPYLCIGGLTDFFDGENVLRKGIKDSSATGRGREVDVV